MAPVTATETYRQRSALPPTAVIKVPLVDVSRADAPAIVFGEQIIPASGKQMPCAFEISYDRVQFESNRTYAVQARIQAAGRVGSRIRPRALPIAATIDIKTSARVCCYACVQP